MNDREIDDILRRLNQLQIKEAQLKEQLKEALLLSAEKKAANNQQSIDNDIKCGAQGDNPYPDTVVSSSESKVKAEHPHVPKSGVEVTTQTAFHDKVWNPTDRDGVIIEIGDEAELLTKGKSVATEGIVCKITANFTTIIDDSGRKFWRAHDNIRILNKQ